MNHKDRQRGQALPWLMLGMALIAAAVPEARGRAQPMPAAGQVAGSRLAPAQAQPSAPTPPDLREEIVRRGPESGLTDAQIESILQRADRLEAANLPSRPVLDRALQGLAKGMPFARIEVAADQLETRLADAGGRVDAVFGDGRGEARQARLGLIDHAAYALGAGATRETLDGAMRLPHDEGQGFAEAIPAVLALGSLASGGMEAEASLEVVRTAWQAEVRGVDLERLGQSLASLGRPGQGPPPEVIERVLGMIRGGVDRERLFEDLDLMRGRGLHSPLPPGMGPGEDPGHMRGPGGSPDQPGHQGPGGHGPPPPRPAPPADPPGRA